jgi:glycosyltransferase involved in cell wall biosynthesis
MRIIMTSDIMLNCADTRANHLLGLFKPLSKLSELYLFVPNNHNRQYDPHIKYIFRFDKIYPIRIISYEISMFIQLFLFCMNLKIDAIYHRQSGLNISPLIISKIFRIPFFVEANESLRSQSTMLSDTYNISKLQLRIAYLSEKINYKYSTKIFAVAEGVKYGIIKSYHISPEKVIVIQNGADTELFKPFNAKKMPLSFNYNINCKYIGFVGSFAPWQGLEYLVNSAPLVLSEFPNVKYVLVGNGALYRKIIELVNELGLKDNFIFVDTVPHEEIPKYINIFDVCVIFKDKDIPSSPLKLAEYMACGKPVIATNSEDFKILKKFNAGILVDPENSEEVRRAIITLLKDDSLRFNMGINALNYVVENRSWKIAAQNIFYEISHWI